jgi:CRP/FNR family transcriptional regulator, anaerobic regulatory protein
MLRKKSEVCLTLKASLKHYTSNPKTLPEKKLQILLNIFHRQEFDKEVVLVNQGDHWNKIYFIERGIVRLFINTPDGQEYNKNFFLEGNFFWPATPETRLRPSLFSIATLETSSIWVGEIVLFQKHLITLKRWETFALSFTEALADQKFNREYEFLILDAEARYMSLLQKYPQLVKRVPDYHLASYLGITNVTLSRIKKRSRF